MLFSEFKQILAPFVSLTIIIMGHGLFSTLVPIKLNDAGFDPWTIGLIASSYFSGLICGSFKIERLVVRVGHIRAYAAFAAIATIIPLLMEIWLNAYYWAGLRFIYGYAIAGLFIVIESWFLTASQPEYRGQILSLYMISYFGACALGQYLLKLEPYLNTGLFSLTSLLAALSVIPLATTYTNSPSITTPEKIDLLELLQTSQSAIIGSFCGGLFVAVILSLFPVYIAANHHAELIPYLMAITIIGGMLFQYPIGKLSDCIDRRKILLLMFFANGICSLLCFAENPMTLAHKELFFFIIGGITATIYPISITLMTDNVDQNKMISAVQGILLFYSLGCVVGPTLAPLVAQSKTQVGIFLFMAIISFLAILTISIRVLKNEPIPQEEKQNYVPTPPVQTATMPELTNPVEKKEDSVYEQC